MTKRCHCTDPHQHGSGASVIVRLGGSREVACGVNVRRGLDWYVERTTRSVVERSVRDTAVLTTCPNGCRHWNSWSSPRKAKFSERGQQQLKQNSVRRMQRHVFSVPETKESWTRGCWGNRRASMVRWTTGDSSSSRSWAMRAQSTPDSSKR